MRKKNICKSALALGLSVAMVFGTVGFQRESGMAEHVTEAAVTSEKTQGDKRIRVDINRDDGRKEGYHKLFTNWLLPVAATQTYTKVIDGVTFKLSTGSGENPLLPCNSTALIKTDWSTPMLVMDGVCVKDGANDTIRLEITGLSAGKHSFRSWHYHTGNGYGAMNVSINGTVIASNIMNNMAEKAQDDNLNLTAYGEFDVAEGEAVVVEVAPTKMFFSPTLCAFEIDGANPFTEIRNPLPEDGDTHYEQENGLSWTAATGATSHDVYFGTSYEEVYHATPGAVAFKGNQTTTKYSFDQELSTFETYYWRVDEHSATGVAKGAVRSFVTARLAFPTAEGYGRYARGGRGGRVIEVVNLNDSGPGSLRDAVENQKGSRIIVFRVGGVIELKSKLIVPADGGDVYIAGQTAPGDGIAVSQYPFGLYAAQDVIMRHVRVRVGDMNGQASDGIGMASCDHSIVDHCSIAWSTDEGHSSRGARNITFQYNIIAEALNASVHYNGATDSAPARHAYAGSISGTKGSYHHNLLVNNTGRNWSLAGNLEQDKVTYAGYLDIRNNVVYNFKDRTTDGGVRRVNFVNNYYKRGAVSRDMKIFTIDGDQITGGRDMQKAYVSGNMLVDKNGSIMLNKTENAWDAKRASAGSYGTNEKVRSDTPFFESYVTTQDADEAYEIVLENAGATMPRRDYLDSRYVRETKEGSYTYKGSYDKLKGIIDSQNDVGGYDFLKANFVGGEAPVDSDHDGMPDAYETYYGLNPQDASDRNGFDLSDEQYTNLEMYLNELAGDDVVYKKGIIPMEKPEKETPTEPPLYVPTPTPKPTATPTPKPTATPTPKPTATPTPKPTATPTPEPTVTPTPEPTVTPTPEPTATPTPKPTATPTPEPTVTPTPEPTMTPTPEPTMTPTPEPQKVLLGDLDGDGKVALSDAQFILRAALKIEELQEEKQFVADVDRDGKLSLNDAQMALKVALKILEPEVVEVTSAQTILYNGTSNMQAVSEMIRQSIEAIRTVLNSF